MKNKALPKSKAKTAYGLLSDVCKLILEEPKRYSQRIYIARNGHDDFGEMSVVEYPSCNTVGCVAGWVASLRTKRFAYEDTFNIARDILGLTESQALELFHERAVDSLFVPQTPKHAKAGVKHIRAFQSKYRRQLLADKV